MRIIAVALTSIAIIALALFGMVTVSATRVRAQEPPQTFTLSVDQTDIGHIGQALNELPKRVADPLISKLNAQIQAQVAERNRAAEEAKKKAEAK
jgi:hypothetical protein